MKKALLFFLLTTCSLLPATTFAQSVDLLWQGEGYTPPFYEGKSLWSKQSLITLVAIPQGLGNANALNYVWSKDGRVLGSLSGIGRNTLKLADTIFSKSMRIRVEIVDVNENTLAGSNATLAPRNPEILIYEKHPLYGYLFHREVGQIFRLGKSEVSFSAFPLFAGESSRQALNLLYRWGTNSEEIQTGHTVTYRVPEEARGTSEVSLTFSDQNKILPELSRSFLVEFGENE